jgi:hypothetical protein
MLKAKKYFLFSVDGGRTLGRFTKDTVTISHHESASFTVVDTGNGYEITDITPVYGTRKYELDYGAMADLFAALKIFYHNADERTGEYWSIYEGEKL